MQGVPREPHPRRAATGMQVLACALAVACWSPVAAAQAAGEPSTMASEAPIVAWLSDIDRYGQRYASAFDDELIRYQAATPDLMAALTAAGWSPSRRYAACTLARLARRPCREVAAWWQANDTADWQAVAAHLDVPPAALRAALAQSYARWGRPVPRAGASR